MKILVDAMGGDHAPAAFISGAFRAANELSADIVLIGRGEVLLEQMKALGYHDLPKGVEIANADEVVSMDDAPASIVHSKKNSSMVLGLKMLADGVGNAFVSAGSTGALLTASTLLVKRIKGIRRAAFGPAIPTKSGYAIIIDAGANIECTPEFLLQFGCLGSLFAKKTFHMSAPRVGLLNNGSEESKGDDLHKQAYSLLQDAHERGVINFVGNIEARDVPLGGADVIVCDGFSGNVLLKSIEGTAMFMGSLMKKMFTKNLFSKIGALLCGKGKEIKDMMDYRQIGGTMLLGITKPVIKAHGSSDALAVFSAIRQAIHAVESGLCEDIKETVGQMIVPKEISSDEQS